MLDYFLETETVLIAYRSIFILYVVSVVLALLLVFFIPETFPGKQKTSQFLEAS
ncbi:MAG: hypothetical protein GX996_07955 [Firmicutes bacterium]|nr:hypothetical protein [Bacillota bacterium]